MNTDNGIYVSEATSFLTNYYNITPSTNLGVELIGEGAWSRCFGFRHGEEELVIRFGNHVDDFQKDQLAYRHAAPALPVPQVLDIGEAFDGYYAISTRARGVPLESVGAAQWYTLVPSIAALLEAMRTADLSESKGFGGWGADGNAASPTWSHDLLSIATEPPNERTVDWRKKLAQSELGQETFDWGVELLKQTVSDSVPRSLIHGDLINRNALVDNDSITGVFDWGCSRYGDHLYDLAWFDFWSPWYPELDMQLLRSALEKRWHEVGYEPEEKDSRLMACYLHIGLDHLAYNAFTGDQVNLLATAERMQVLVPDS